jgi:hypothetical protein
MDQDRTRDQVMPTRPSSREQTHGSRRRTNEPGSDHERNRADADGPTSTSGGITNRPLDREQREQHHLPERGDSQSER